MPVLNEKNSPSSALTLTDRQEITLSPSISHLLSKYAIEMETSKPFGRFVISLDSFSGSVRAFRLYLKAQRVLFNAGFILP